MKSQAARVIVLGNDEFRVAGLQEGLRARGVPAAHVPLSHTLPPFEKDTTQAAVLVCDGSDAERRAARAAIERLSAESVPTLVWGPIGADSINPLGDVADGACLEEVLGRLTAITHYAPLIRQMDAELSHLHRLATQLNQYFEHIDKEMRMAGRLQRDFMPRIVPAAPRLRFHYLFRPASFVSGDIFDIIPIGPHHMGIFLADAMGHGTSAGLMTMYLRKALSPWTGDGANRGITPPADALRAIHDALARHQLPSAQFVTAAYGVIDTRTLELVMARGGHPHPIVIRASGEIGEIAMEGGLMGLADVQPSFEQTAASLAPGDKLILYTDGVEHLFVQGRQTDPPEQRFTDLFRSWSMLDIEAIIESVAAELDQAEGSLNPVDDVTVLAMQITE